MVVNEDFAIVPKAMVRTSECNLGQWGLFTTIGVASILYTDLDAMVQHWMALVEPEGELARGAIELRLSHDRVACTNFYMTVIKRLRLSGATVLSSAASQHGELRRLQTHSTCAG